MCSLVGWAGNLSESVRFRIKINTILADAHFRVFPEPGMRGTGTENGHHVLPVGWAGNVSESICFRITINTILAEDHFGFFLAPDQAATLRKRLSASRYVFWTHFRAKGLRF